MSVLIQYQSVLDRDALPWTLQNRAIRGNRGSAIRALIVYVYECVVLYILPLVYDSTKK